MHIHTHPSQARVAGASYITYSVDSEGHTLSREEGSPLNQAVPLYKTFKHILQDMHTAYRLDLYTYDILPVFNTVFLTHTRSVVDCCVFVISANVVFFIVKFG